MSEFADPRYSSSVCADPDYALIHCEPPSYNTETGELYFAKTGESSGLVVGGSRDLHAPLYTKCLDSFDPPALGNRIQVWACNRSPQQLWYVLWGTTIRLLDHYQGCLALPGNNPVAGTRVQVYQCTGAANQQWVLDPTNGAITWG